jgi:hypothetical protein
MKQKQLIIFFALSLLIFSCKKHEASTATISIIEPITNDTIAFGESLHYEGTVTGNGELHGYSVKLVNDQNGTILSEMASDNHAENYSFHEHWVNTLLDTTVVKLTVEVILDHEGNKVSKDVSVVCLPN